jgi:hypothetical protein
MPRYLVSVSLWGSERKYVDGLRRLLARLDGQRRDDEQVCVRVHHDDTVGADTLRSLADRCDLVDCTAWGLQGERRAMWRLRALVDDDDCVDCVCITDVDVAVDRGDQTRNLDRWVLPSCRKAAKLGGIFGWRPVGRHGAFDLQIAASLLVSSRAAAVWRDGGLLEAIERHRATSLTELGFECGDVGKRRRMADGYAMDEYVLQTVWPSSGAMLVNLSWFVTEPCAACDVAQTCRRCVRARRHAERTTQRQHAAVES